MIVPAYFSKTYYPEYNKGVARFVSKEIYGNYNSFEKYCTMGVFRDGNIIAGTVYHNYHEKEGVIELSSASIDKKWLTRQVIRAMLWLPFNRLGCQLAVLRVGESNKTMIGIARKFGFNETFIPRLRGRNEGEYIFTLSDDDWKESKYYKEVA